MKKKIVVCLLALFVVAAGSDLWAQQHQPTNVMVDSLEEAFLGANPEKVAAVVKTANPEKTLKGTTVAPLPEKPALSDEQKLEKLMGVSAVKGIKGVESLKGPARAFVVAAYSTGTPVVNKASRISWDKISGVVTSGGNQPEIIVTSPGGVFDISGSSYILSEAEQGIMLTFVTNGRKSTIILGSVEGAFITADGYVCRVKRYEEG